jgi:hypothetical protein
MQLQGLTFPANPSKRTHLASFGLVFSLAGYKMGYKAGFTYSPTFDSGLGQSAALKLAFANLI